MVPAAAAVAVVDDQVEIEGRSVVDVVAVEEEEVIVAEAEAAEEEAAAEEDGVAVDQVSVKVPRRRLKGRRSLLMIKEQRICVLYHSIHPSPIVRSHNVMIG